MVNADLSARELAKRSGYALGTVYNLLAETSTSLTGRRKIEEILGPIWSTLESSPADTLSGAAAPPANHNTTDPDTTTTQPVP